MRAPMDKPSLRPTLAGGEGSSPGSPTSPLLESLRAEQRGRWGRGDRLLVESYLEQQPTIRDDPEAILDLIYNEIVLSEETGEAVTLAEYQERFPQLTAQLTDLFDVHRALENTPSAT